MEASEPSWLITRIAAIIGQSRALPASEWIFTRSSIFWNATCLLSVQMAHSIESLFDVVVKLGGLLQRPDLTEDERQRYLTDFVKLTQKCLMASELFEQQKLQAALDLVSEASLVELSLESVSSLN